jgi:hypothetical protein
MDDLACQSQNGKFSTDFMMDFGEEIHQNQKIWHMLESSRSG